MSESDLVDVHRVARAFHCTERQVQLLVLQGMPKAGHAKYDLRACLAWYKERSAQKRPWRSLQKRMATERASRATLRAVRRELMALPTRIAPALEGLSRMEIVQKLRSFVDEIAASVGAIPQQEDNGK
jgi:hypothetical protein